MNINTVDSTLLSWLNRVVCFNPLSLTFQEELDSLVVVPLSLVCGVWMSLMIPRHLCGQRREESTFLLTIL